MTYITGTAGAGTTPAGPSVTVPVGVTASMVGLFVYCTSAGTDWDPVPASSGATFTLLDDRAATNLRVTVWSGTGLVAGAVVTSTATVNQSATLWHVYQDEFTYNTASLSAAVRAGSSVDSVSGSLTPSAGQTVIVIGAERTTATGTAVSGVVSTGGETTTTRLFSEETNNVSSVFVGSFVASAAASRTVTITYTTGSGNGYAALITTTPVVVPVPAAVWPAAPLDLAVELYLNSAWVEITSYVRRDPGILITRGRPDEASSPSPAACRLAVNNRDGRFSPRLPTGTYYGQIGRNTPLRVSVPSATTWLSVDTATARTLTATGVSTPDSADLDVTGDIDIRFDADMDSWREDCVLVSKWTETGNQRSYSFQVTSTGLLRLNTTTSGAVGTRITGDSTIPVPVTEGRLTVRVTLDVDNGAAGKTWTFYYGTGGVNGSFTQLGTAVTTAGTTSIFSSTAIGYLLVNPDNSEAASANGPGYVVRSRVFGAQIMAGIAGTIRANPDFTIQTNGATSFVDTSLTTPKTWTLVGAVSLTNRVMRFSGQVPSWSVATDVSGTDIWTDVEASGKLRQLGQGDTPLSTTLANLADYQGTSVVAYWGCEDPEGSVVFSSGLAGGRPMTISGAPQLAAYTGTLKSTNPIPNLNSSIWTGIISPYTATTTISAGFLLVVQSGGDTNNCILFRMYSTGAVGRTDVSYTTAASGTLSLACYDKDGTVLASGVTITGVNDTEMYVQVLLSEGGGSVGASIQVEDLATGTVTANSSGSFSTTIGRASKVTVNPGGFAVTSSIGQISVRNSAIQLSLDTTASGAARAYVGETAGRRIERLCLEHDIDFKGVGDLDYTAAMGPQLAGGLLDLMQDCVDADLGILFEPREILGLGYRTRTSQYNQTARLTLDYASAQMDALVPVEDDQLIRNDVTVTRTGGAGARVIQTTGRLSVQEPPSGVGAYDEALEVNYFTDDQVADAASWRVSNGTIDEARYPAVPLTVNGPHLSSMAGTIADLDLGDRFVITNPPAWVPPETIQQILQATNEYLANIEWSLILTGSPAVVLDVGRYAAATVSGANQYKYSSDGTTVRSTMTTTSTTLDLTTASGPLWTIDAAQYPIDLMVAGERMTATSGSGTTSSTQSMVVTRSVNGVVKTHAVGETVALFRPARYAF